MAKETAAAKGALVVPVEGMGGPLEVTGAGDPRLAHRLVSQLAETLWLPASLPDAERIDRVSAAIAALRGLAPRDEMEGMLAAQMAATHAAAMDCLSRAMRSGETTPAVDWAMRQATRLLALYAKQVETWNRNRGKGQQRMTVEHVRVESGGQAIVGQVVPRGAITP